MVEEKIKQVVESIDGISYMFNDWTRANVEFDFEKTTFPVCLNLLPVSGQLHLHNGIFRDYPNCMIAFLDKTDLDFEGDENEVIVERMKGFAKKFIVAVNKSGLFKYVDESVNYSVVYDTLDQNLTGVVISMKLKELTGDCVI